MPTQPLDTILDRDLSRVAAKEIIDVASPLLQELVNYGSNLFIRCLTSAKGIIDEDSAVLALYRHTLEMTDGIEVLISQSCPIPAIPLLRSSFEALLGMEFILQNEKEYIRRSLSWLVGHAHQELSMYEQYDPTTDRGKQFVKIWAKDIRANKRVFPINEKRAKDAISRMKNFLSKDHIKTIEGEYQRCKKRKQGRPNWYQLYNGPSNLCTLAQELGWGAYYEVLYRQWSKIGHAQDFQQFTGPTVDGLQSVRGLRYGQQIKDVANFASCFMLEANRLFLNKFRAEELSSNYRKWFLEEVRDRYKVLYQSLK
jgi:hypothetical protein